MPLSAIWQHPALLRLIERLQVAAPYFFTHRLDLTTDLAAQECIDILKAETSPIPEKGAVWGIKHVVAAFETSRIVLFRFKAGVYGFCPVYIQVEPTQTGSIIHCWASMHAGVRLTLALCYLAGIGFPTAMAIGKPHLFRTKADLIAFGIIFVGFPLMAWALHRFLRKNYNETAAFIAQFLCENLKASPLAENSYREILDRASPVPRKKAELLFTFLEWGLAALMAYILSHALGLLIAWLPHPYGFILLAGSPFIAILGVMIFLLVRDPAFRKKASSQAPSQDGKD
jgi:hypothetical protein